VRVLVTGGLGFIGINLVKSLLKSKKIKKIIIIDDMSKNSDNNLKSICKFTKTTSSYVSSRSRVHLIKASITHTKIALQATKNIDFVVHLAAESGVDFSIKNPMRAFDTNVIGAFNYLEASRANQVKRFIFASSGAVFGDVKPPIRESDKRNPISPYGSSKLAVETYCETYSKIFKLGTTVLRFSNAYGPYSKHKNSVIHKFVRNILDKKSIRINGNGNHTRDFIYVDDIVSAIKLNFKKKNSNDNYNISTGKETSLKKLVQLLISIFNTKYNKKIKYIYGKERLGDMLRNYSSNSKIKKDLLWKPKIKLEEGIKKTINWYVRELGK
jgi:UDP-glucose 4-epimerase